MRITFTPNKKGTQIWIDIEESHIIGALHGSRLGEVLEGEILGEQFKGCKLMIWG
jgi:ribosomal protein S6E (S10)